MAAVISKYADDKNELMFICNKPMEIEAFTMKTASEELKLTKKEAIALMDQAIKEKHIFLRKSEERIKEIISRRGDFIKYINSPTEELQVLAVNSMPYAIRFIKDACKQVKKVYLKKASYDSCRMGYMRNDEKFFNELSEEEIIEIISERPEAMAGVPEQKITAKMIIVFLKKIASEEGHPFLEGGFDNISEKFKDAFYYRAFCIANGYNFSRIPKDRRDEIITKALVEYCVDHPKKFIGTLWMYEYIPEKFKTEEISIKCILHHFACVEYLPEKYKNDTFYTKLIGEVKSKTDNFYWFENIDPKTMSKELFEKTIIENNITKINPNTPKNYITKQVAITISQNLNNEIPKKILDMPEVYNEIAELGQADFIPEDKFTMDICKKLIKSRKYRILKKIPEKFKTPELYKYIVEESCFNYLTDVPEEYLTVEIVKDYIKEGFVYSFKEIPEGFHSTEIAELLVESVPDKINIPKEFQTEELCKKILDRYDKNKYEWFLILKNCKYKTQEAINYAVQNFSNAIELEGLNEEQIKKSIERYPLNVLKAPEWFFNAERKNSDINEISIESINMDTKWEQMSIFDILTA